MTDPAIAATDNRTDATPPFEQVLAALEDLCRQLDDEDAGFGPDFVDAMKRVAALVAPRLLAGDARWVDALVERLTGEERFSAAAHAWGVFLDHFCSHVLQPPGEPVRFTLALAAIERHASPADWVAIVESTAPLADALSEGLFGRPGLVRVNRELVAPEDLVPDFQGFAHFLDIASPERDEALAEQVADANRHLPEIDAHLGWDTLDEAERARLAPEREVILAISVEPPDTMREGPLSIVERAGQWLDAHDDLLELPFVAGGRRQTLTLEPLDIGLPFSTAWDFRHFLLRQLVQRELVRCRQAAGDPSLPLRALVTFVTESDSPAGDMPTDDEVPQVAPMLSFFDDRHPERLVGGVLLDAADHFDSALQAIAGDLAQQDVTALDFCEEARPLVWGDDAESPLFYDARGGTHPLP